MTGLVLPRHVAAAIHRNDRTAAAVANTIASKTVVTHRYDSDDFVTPDDVRQQLAELGEFINARREAQPGYHLPQPSGWKISFLFLTIPGETASGLVFASDQERESRSIASPQGVVLALGVNAYRDPRRFGESGPWHKVGDRLTFTKYDAASFQLANGQRLGILNDTQPLALIDSGWEVPS